MAAVASPPHSPSPSPHRSSPHQSLSPIQSLSPTSHPASLPSPLPQINTAPGARRVQMQRPPSYARSRMSTFSASSRLSDRNSRPVSTAFPLFHSSLSYALVRDFAYPEAHPCHYGPPPIRSEPQSGSSTPAIDFHRRLSDPPNGAWDSTGSWGDSAFYTEQQLPQMAYGDGPPYSEDEDLHSPIVKSARHKKHFSGSKRKNRASQEPVGTRGYLAGVNEDGSATYYINDENETADGPGGELVTYPPEQVQYATVPRRMERLHRSLVERAALRESNYESDAESSGILELDDSRYSRDYQFTIASPDEEMHGKAVALFDFTRENENELPLTEGQVIWVSYRHGQGWLVAEDPKTGDAGLVPEEYVRLLKDIEGGMSSLSGDSTHEDQPPPQKPQPEPDASSPEKEEEEVDSPAKSDSSNDDSEASPPPPKTSTAQSHSPKSSTSHPPSEKEKHPPAEKEKEKEKKSAVVSSFSTSSKDLDPYPHPLPQQGQMPPQVVHYGSQANTPTVRSPAVGHAPGLFKELKGDKES